MAGTCEDRIYVANKLNEAQITNIHYWDSAAGGGAGAWSANLVAAATPFPFLPAAVLATDLVIFGIDQGAADYGPFCSLVFDLSVVIGPAVTAITWRYSDAGSGVDPTGWAALTTRDNTNQDGAMTGVAFDTLGVNSVHWNQPTNWTARNPQVGGGAALGTTGLWVCADMTTVGGGAAGPPQQDNRAIYSILWPYIEIEEADAPGGDVAALLRAELSNCSYDPPILAGCLATRLFLGLRSLSRGDDFVGFLNISDTQVPPFVTWVVGASTLFGASYWSPTGRAAIYTSGAAADAMATRVDFTITGADIALYSWQFAGTYRVFLRVFLPAASTAFSARVIFNGPTNFTTPTVAVPSTTDPQALDLGLVTLGIPGEPYTTGLIAYSGVGVQLAYSAIGAPNILLHLMDLVLIPVDECSVEIGPPGWANLGYSAYYSYLEIDGGVEYLKTSVTSCVRLFVEDRLLRRERVIGNEFILQANAAQRLWILSLSSAGTPAPTWDPSRVESSERVRLEHVARYLSMRGAR